MSGELGWTLIDDLRSEVAMLKLRLNEAQAQAEKGLAGSMEGHAAMDMSVGGDGTVWQRLLSPDGFTAVSGVCVMEWAAVLRDIGRIRHLPCTIVQGRYDIVCPPVTADTWKFTSRASTPVSMPQRRSRLA